MNKSKIRYLKARCDKTYSVIYSPKEFKDVENHWAKTDINDMASRLVLDGVDENTFEPDRDITRAEVATILKRILQKSKLI